MIKVEVIIPQRRIPLEIQIQYGMIDFFVTKYELSIMYEGRVIGNKSDYVYDIVSTACDDTEQVLDIFGRIMKLYVGG